MSATSDFYVYVLFRENGAPFYVGKGRDKRINRHASEAFNGRATMSRTRVVERILAHRADIPSVKIHEGLTEVMAYDYEQNLIAAIGRYPQGPLVNFTDGGDGVRGHIQSAEANAKRSAALKGRQFTPEHRANLKGPKHPEHRAKMRQPKSPEHRAKIAAALRGKPKTPEHRAKMSIAARRRGHTVSTT